MLRTILSFEVGKNTPQLSAHDQLNADYLAALALKTGNHCNVNTISQYGYLIAGEADPNDTEVIAARLRSIKAIKAACGPEYVEAVRHFRFDPCALDDFDSAVAISCHAMRMAIVAVGEAS
jgi:hypothetical protein